MPINRGDTSTLCHQFAAMGVSPIVGPHDLSVSLDAPEQWDNPKLHRLIEDTIARCRAASIGVGVHLSTAVFSPPQIKRLIALGMNWILDGADGTLALNSFKQRRAALCGTEVPRPNAEPAGSVPCIAPSVAASPAAVQ